MNFDPATLRLNIVAMVRKDSLQICLGHLNFFLATVTDSQPIACID
jgi:hypothetical protein